MRKLLSNHSPLDLLVISLTSRPGVLWQLPLRKFLQSNSTALTATIHAEAISSMGYNQGQLGQKHLKIQLEMPQRKWIELKSYIYRCTML